MIGEKRSEILQVNCIINKVVPKIVYDLHKYYDQNVESVVCYGRGQKESEKSVYKTSSELLAKFNALRSVLRDYSITAQYLRLINC